ncbi:MAG: type I-E CRISPR-associated protein Cas7/Cse4/CasC [Chloroflexi bacterium]|nr:type I-E CRISPR-associated protein Cas7/Cse4/CasC [Chloroflexota bacterium]
MFVEIHLLQSFAPSNLNRDDTGSPKECEFGGVRRARISSQCLKRSIRTAPVFERTTQVPTARRTKRIIGEVAARLIARGRDLDASTKALSALIPVYLSKLDSKNPELTAVLLHVSEAELTAIQEAVEANWEGLLGNDAKTVAGKITKDLIKSFQTHTSAPDVALFGRMLAEKPELGLEAACQVAHAISTHRISMEMDFYTAVDDLNPDDTAGAGMMGIIAYDSACYYRYMRVDWEHLVQNLDGDAALARRTLEGFIRAAEEAVPSGKQNSFAANNPPSLALAVVREDGMGWNLVNAFERPVRATGDGGYVVPSVAALDAYWGALCDAYGTDTLRCVAARTLGNDLPVQTLAPYLIPGREAWLQTVLSAIPQEA